MRITTKTQVVTSEGFRAFAPFLQDACGIVLDDNKEYLVTSRLNRLLTEYKLDSLHSLLEALKSGRHLHLKNLIIDAMTTNETFWFRDNSHFELLSESILPDF